MQRGLSLVKTSFVYPGTPGSAIAWPAPGGEVGEVGEVREVREVKEVGEVGEVREVREVPALPREVWQLVLSLLRPQDLCRAMLVSQDWAEAAGDPGLWREYRLRVRAREEGEELGTRLARLLALNRSFRTTIVAK